MNKPFSIDCEPDWMMRESVASAVPSEAPAKPVWSFLGDFDALAGDCTEPDAQFFVDTWTVGVAAAMRNLEKRQSTRNLRTAAEYSPARPADFPEENAFNAELSAASREWAARTMDAPPVDEVRAYEYEEVSASRGAMSKTRARQILGVALFSTRSEIKAAYRHQAACWHPDRMAWSTPEARHQATEQMTLINEAYRLLR